MGAYLSTTFCIHSVSINIELSLPPRCLSISCIHFVSYVDFPYWPLRHFLRFCCCNIRTSPASTTSCMHLVSISKFHPPRAIVSNKNHKQDNVGQFVGNLCELEGPRCLNRSTLGVYFLERERKRGDINHLSVHQWLRSAIRDSQQPTSPIGFLFLKLPPPPCAVLLVSNQHQLNVV